MKSSKIHHLIFCLFLLLANSAHAQQKGMKPATGNATARTERRIALVVGNKDYQKFSKLQNPVNDATDMRVALSSLGFEVIEVINVDYRGFVNAVNKFKEKLIASDVALFYYSGHGLGYGGKNYLLPVDAEINCLEQIDEYGVSLNRILGDIAAKGVKNSFVFLDACRNVPNLKVCDNSRKEATVNAGLVRPSNNPRGSMVVYATEEGSFADDNRQGRNGLFTAALLRYFTKPNMGIRQILDQTTIEVEKRSNGGQSPGRYDKLQGDFVFVKKVEPSLTRPEPVTPTPKSEEPVRTEPPAPATSKVFLDLPFADMAYIEGGTFEMGDTRGEGEPNEKPVHKVTISSFWMGKYEITQRQWKEIMESTPSNLGDNCADCPVENVSWKDAQEFLTKLNARTGGNYRLPTEAEWEYAAGGGATARTRFGNGQDVLKVTEANFDGNQKYKQSYSDSGKYRKNTIKAGSFPKNSLGLYDMTGNVMEWCSDRFDDYSSGAQTNPTGPSKGADRIVRGGCWHNAPQSSRVTYRKGYPPSTRNNYVGFRVVVSQ